jgi:hypothetical protein
LKLSLSDASYVSGRCSQVEYSGPATSVVLV